VLEESKCERDLGVLVDNELKFGQQVDAVVLKANRQLGLIKRSFTYLDEKKHWCCCTRLVRPILEYERERERERERETERIYLPNQLKIA